MATTPFPTLLSPGRIGPMELRNRMMVMAMGVNFAETDGSASDRIIAYHEAQARGGVGLVITGATGVAHPVGRVQGWQAAISEDRHIPGLKRLVDAVHRHGAKAAVQLHHGGLQAGDSARDGLPLWAPAIPVPVADADFMSYFLAPELARLMEGMTGRPQIKVMDKDDIALFVRQFADATRRAKEAGFDAAEIHAGHGYVLSSFISPKFNTRTDEYGGSTENRARLLVEVIRAVREAGGPDFAVLVKIDAVEAGKKGGTTIEHARVTARLAEEAGAHAIVVSSYHETAYGKLHSASNVPLVPNVHLDYAATLRREVSVPLVTSGRVELARAEQELAKGTFDFFGMGRMLLADPDLPNKLAAGRMQDIRPCVYCVTCASAIYTKESTRCAVNADLGVEYQRAVRPRAAAARHVAIVGGGPAGMEAALRLAEDGHRVTLLERGPRLGGTLQFAALAYEPNQRFLEWLRREVGKAEVDVRLGTAATPELLRSLAPDAVIVATGARREMPPIPGSELPHVYSGDDMRKLVLGESSPDMAAKTTLFTRLATRVGAATGITANLDLVRRATKLWMPFGRDIVVIGGEIVGLELAEFLLERGRRVTVVDELPVLGGGLPIVRRMRLIADLREHGVALHAGAGGIRIDRDAVRFTDREGASHAVPASEVIVAKGAVGDPRVADQLRAAGFAVVEAGDCAGIGYIEGAIRGARDAVDAVNARG